MKASTARSPLPWFGGKQKLAERIVALMPPHEVYVEVFGGGASVLLTKPEGQLDIYNDAEDGLVNFFRCLRDRPNELVPKLALTPYARSEYEHCRLTWQDEPDELERARKFYAVVAQAFGGGGLAQDDDGRSARGWGGETKGRLHLSRAASTANRVDHTWRFVWRFRRVQIDNLDWRDCLDRYDGPGVVIYLDPPYVPSTRRAGRYRHELTAADHGELVERIVTLEGHSIVSGYDHDIYRSLEDRGFDRHEFSVLTTASKAKTQDRARIEIVWARPTRQISLLAEACEW